MEIHKSKLTKTEIDWILKFYKTRVEGESILSSGELWINKHVITRLLLAIPVYWVLFYVLSWDDQIYLLIIAFVISLLISDLVDLIVSTRHLPRRFLAWDGFIVIHKERNLIKCFPSYQLTNISHEAFSEDYFAIKLTFLNGTIEWPESLTDGKEIKKFRSKLIESSNAVKEKMKTKNLNDLSTSDEFTDTEKRSYQFLINPNSSKGQSKGVSKLNFLQRNLITIPSALILFLVQYFLMPYALDFFSFEDSQEKNTASAYRTYLSNTRNNLYREEAEKGIQGIYDGYIHKLNSINESFDKQAVVRTLEYLRDNKVYIVNVHFNFSSNVKDIYRRGLRVISAENSFTREKNEEREARLVQEINNSIGKILPTDIVTFSTNRQSTSPTIEINYKYLNSKDNSLYYPVAQESLSDDLRTYYYGVSVSWDFKWYLPTESKFIVAFDLTSNPRMQFSTESSASDDTVYSDMIYTAFEEMATEFNRLYLPTSKIGIVSGKK